VLENSVRQRRLSGAPGRPLNFTVRGHANVTSDKLQRTRQVVVSFEFSRHVGPRFVHGAVRLRFDSLRPYSFESRARWPTTDNYEAEFRREVEAVLRERLGSVDRCQVILEDITWDAVNSCAAGFARAARAATEMAFQV
jgi:hypothetical protein